MYSDGGKRERKLNKIFKLIYAYERKVKITDYFRGSKL